MFTRIIFHKVFLIYGTRQIISEETTQASTYRHEFTIKMITTSEGNDGSLNKMVLENLYTYIKKIVMN